MEKCKTDILIIGGGLAAMMAALEASASPLSLLLASKGKVGKSGATLMAGCNFAGVLPEAEENGDSLSLHAEDTFLGGAKISDPELVRILAANAPADLLLLEKLGLEFSKRDGRFDLRQSPGHRRPRTVCTVNPGLPIPIRGRTITAPLRRQVLERSIPLLEGIHIVKLIVRDGRAAGALGIRRADGETVAIECRAAILASGGGGFLYERNTNPGDITGDSYPLALEAGCSLRDMEFVQFFPCVHLGSPRIPIASPIFADGAVLRNRDGERFLARYEPERLELATRDRVSRAIFREVQQGRGVDGGVYLDFTAVPRDLLAFRSSDLLTLFQKRGVDLHRQWIPVTPATHFFMGGVAVDTLCRTSVAGLFAAGEATGGLHGANRLSGNGLSDALVFGRIAGKSAAAFAAQTKPVSIPEQSWQLAAGQRGPKISGEKISRLRREIKKEMWERVGLIRRGPGLAEALGRFEDWQNSLEEAQPERAADASAYSELRAMLLAARTVTHSALFREESRGAHFREDFPEADPAWAKSVTTRFADGKFHSALGP